MTEGTTGRCYSVSLAGVMQYQQAVRASRIGERVELVPEPSNPHDKRAIAAITEFGELVGYLPRGGWLTEAILDEGKEVTAVIADMVEVKADRYGLVLEVSW